MVVSADRAQLANTIHNGEFWMRCPHCGDTKNDHEKAHYSVRLRDGVYFCLRCNASGRLNRGERFDLVGSLPVASFDVNEDNETDDRLEKILEALEPKAGNPTRISRLPRYRYVDDKGKVWDAFLSYDLVDTEPIGILLRSVPPADKQAYFYGTRGFAWWGADRGHQLVSSPEDPIRLVEGPYDALTTRDVVVFGLITKHNLSEFLGHSIILCPDGDVWQKDDLRKTTITSLRYLLRSSRSKPYLVGLEYLPNGKDPDEVKPEDRALIPRRELFDLFPNRSRTWIR